MIWTQHVCEHVKHYIMTIVVKHIIYINYYIGVAMIYQNKAATYQLYIHIYAL